MSDGPVRAETDPGCGRFPPPWAGWVGAAILLALFGKWLYDRF